MLKYGILGDLVPWHRRNWFALVYRSSLILAFLLALSQVFLYSASFAHSNTYKDANFPIPTGWRLTQPAEVTLQDLGNNLYVSARLNEQDGPLKAFASTPSTDANSWEKFNILQNEAQPQYYALRAEGNGLYASARCNEQDCPLKAFASTPSTDANSWEEFEIKPVMSPRPPLPVPNVWALESRENGLYVSARLNEQDGPLKAFASTPSTDANSWERFVIKPAKQVQPDPTAQSS